MKRILTNMLMAVAITGPFVTSLAAQTQLEADIPFAFVAANQTMPAGRYIVSQYRSGSPIFLLNDGRRKAIFVQLGKIDALGRRRLLRAMGVRRRSPTQRNSCVHPLAMCRGVGD